MFLVWPPPAIYLPVGLFPSPFGNCLEGNSPENHRSVHKAPVTPKVRDKIFLLHVTVPAQNACRVSLGGVLGTRPPRDGRDPALLRAQGPSTDLELHVRVTALVLTSWVVKDEPSDLPDFLLEKWVRWP